MSQSLLYVTTVLIWGSTWLAITYQLPYADPLVSIAYRFALASAVLFVVCRIWGVSLALPRRAHGWMALMGVMLFCLNYILFYQAQFFIPSGLVALTFSTVIVMNVVNGWVFLRQPIRRLVLIGGGVGLVGMTLIFWPKVQTLAWDDRALIGLLLGIAATYAASVGNIVSAYQQRQGWPVMSCVAYGMGYGALTTALMVMLTGRSWAVEVTPIYLLSLGYLVLFGSVIGFVSYLTLLGRMGADRVAYTALLFPVVALGLSTIFEGYLWTTTAFGGVVLVLVGNALALVTPTQWLALLQRLQLAYEVACERQQLARLDDALLKDVGLSRADAWREARRPCWESRGR